MHSTEKWRRGRLYLYVTITNTHAIPGGATTWMASTDLNPQLHLSTINIAQSAKHCLHSARHCLKMA